MHYPTFLKKNDVIGLVAPSFGCEIEPYASLLESSIAYFKKIGYEIFEGNNIRSNLELASDTPVRRANDFMKLYQSDVRIIWSVGGGEVMFEILPFIDFELLKRLPPKFFIGYSDNTCLTFLLTTLCDVSSIYGLHFPSYGARSLHEQNHDLLSLLKGEKHSFSSYGKYEIDSLRKNDYLSPINPTIDVKWKTLNEQHTMTGRLIGGCLDVLLCICGTKYDQVDTFIDKYQDDGFIWYLDSCDLNSLSFYRGLLQLEYAGWFKNVKGFVIGRILSTIEPYDFTFKTAMKKILLKYNVPVFYDVDLGHLPPSLPIVNGAIATITCTNEGGKISYLYK